MPSCACSLLRSGDELADRFDHVAATWRRLAGSARVGFNNSVYLSERRTADRNFALGYFMREQGAFPEGTDLVETLEFYFQCCSIELDAQSLAVVAATFANAGINPLTNDPVFTPSTVRHCLSLMSSCGMYDYSGEFAFTIGLPAKSGVSGGLMLVVPGVMGVCVWSPRLDALGNSVRGVAFCKELVTRYNFHVFDSLTVGEDTGKRDPRRKKNEAEITGTMRLLYAASQGDLDELRAALATGCQPQRRRLRRPHRAAPGRRRGTPGRGPIPARRRGPASGHRPLGRHAADRRPAGQAHRGGRPAALPRLR